MRVTNREISNAVRWVQSNAGNLTKPANKPGHVLNVDWDQITIVNNCGYTLKKFTPVAIGDLVDATPPTLATDPNPGYVARKFYGELVDYTNMHRTAVVLSEVADGDTCKALINGVVPGRIDRTTTQYTDDYLMPVTNNSGGEWKIYDGGPLMRWPGAARAMSRYSDTENGYDMAMLNLNSSDHIWEFQGTPNMDLSSQTSITLSGTKKSIWPENDWASLTNPVVTVATTPFSGDSGTIWRLRAQYAYAEIYGVFDWEADDGEQVALYATHANSSGTIQTELNFMTLAMPGDTTDGGSISVAFRTFVPGAAGIVQNNEYMAVRAAGAGTIKFQSQWIRFIGVGFTRGEFDPQNPAASIVPISYMNQIQQGTS